MRSDPSRFFGTVGSVAASLLSLLVAFGVDLTAEQTEAVLTFIATAGPALVAVGIGRIAFRPSTVDAERAQAWSEGFMYADDEQSPDPEQTDNRTRDEDGPQDSPYGGPVPQHPDWRP